MEMLVCSADGATYAIAFADVQDPAGVTAALDELRSLAAGNIGAPSQAASAVQVPGMTPNPGTARVEMAGRLPDGAPVEERAIFFSKGLRVYQASVVGRQLVPEAAEMFLSAPRLMR